MHQTAIAPAVTERAIDRRGQLRAFSCLRPEQTALVVVDMQNGFVAPDALAEVPAAREIVSNINRIGAALRSAGGRYDHRICAHANAGSAASCRAHPNCIRRYASAASIRSSSPVGLIGRAVSA